MRIATLLFVTLVLGVSDMVHGQERGLIGETKEDGLPVIYKLVDEVPSEEVRNKFRWLTVISWKYDRSVRNGMPPENTNKQMISLEDVIDSLEKSGWCLHAYSRTGNGVKELVYYIHDREQFMAAFNEALSKHPGYPLEINFYEDAGWEDFQKILGLFNGH